MSEQPPVDLGLSDDDFWTDPFKTRLELDNQLLDDERAVLVIGAPTTVAYQKRETLPLVVMRADKQDTLARMRFRPTAVVVAVDLTRNKTYAKMAVTEDIVEPPPYDGPPLEGWGTEAWLIDLREQLGVPWTRGELLVSIIMRDSMTHRVRLTLAKGGYRDPAVDEYLEQTAGAPAATPISPAPSGQDEGGGLPSYRAHDDSPAIPDTRGVSLVVPRVIERGPGLRAVARGSFRLATLPSQVGPGDAGGPPSTATVAITLVLTGSDIPEPFVFEIQAPSYDPVGGTAKEPEITGYFNLDLQRLGNLNDIDQTYFIYAFSGETLTGPAPMALVTR